MTLQELYDSVAQLGFEEYLEDDKRFFLCANRALLQVNAIKPATAVYRLNHFPLKNQYNYCAENLITKATSEEVIIEGDDIKSYSFECDGNGTVYIEKFGNDGKWTIIDMITLSANIEFVVYRGFVEEAGKPVRGAVRIRFTGAYLYHVQNVGLYSQLLSDRLEDIPIYDSHIQYDLTQLVSDFMSLTYPPIVDAGQNESISINVDYYVESDTKILLPASISGVYKVRYNRRIREISENDDRASTYIDLEPELCALLPNLIAHYIWADDEPAKADQYMSLYREQVALITQKIRRFEPATYRSNGW